jgi:uncharacterized damage-inducible protein DinB
MPWETPLSSLLLSLLINNHIYIYIYIYIKKKKKKKEEEEEEEEERKRNPPTCIKVLEQSLSTS